MSARTRLLCDEPGVGKTATTVRAMDKSGARRILVMCPSVVKSNWANEVVRWSQVPRTINLIDGLPRNTPGAGVTIVGHASLVVPSTRGGSAQIKQRAKLAIEGVQHLMVQPWDVVIVDEAHEFRKLEAKRTQGLYGSSGLLSRAYYSWLLTGTPVVNSASDLYPVFYGPLSSCIPPSVDWWKWCNQFTNLVPDGLDGLKPVGIKNHNELAALLRPHMLRRTLHSVGIQLPPLTLQPLFVDASKNALIEIMAGLEGWTPERLEHALESQDEIRDSAIARVRRAVGLAKVPAIANWLRGLLAQDNTPIVCFYQHTEVMEQVCVALEPYRVAVIKGGLTPSKLKFVEREYQAGNFDVLMVQTQAGGMGLTLTRGWRSVVAELPWTATYLFQAVKRVHRYTQTKAVTADILLLNGCWLDDVMLRVVQRKWSDEQAFMNLLTT